MVFVVLSIFSAGLSLSIYEIQEPFKSTRLLISALVANFVLVPLSAYLIAKTIAREQSLGIALLLLGTASGAPMLPKLVEFARGSLALAVGLMALMMAGTIVTMPLVLPMLLPGAHTSSWLIARPLLLVIFPSLAAGLSLRAYRKTLAARLQPIVQVASSIALAVVVLVAVLSNFSNVAGIGSLHTIFAGTTLFLISFGIGFTLGGRDADARKVLALGTTQRSVSVAFLVAIENFGESNVVNVLAILALLALVIQVPAAFTWGTRAKRQNVNPA
jgi:predicted Na+-dependent transporter